MVSVRQTTMKKKSTGKSTTKETKRNLEFKRKKNKESSEEEKNNSQTLAPISTQGKYILKFGKAPKRLNDKDKKSGSTETKKLKLIAEGNEQVCPSEPFTKLFMTVGSIYVAV